LSRELRRHNVFSSGLENFTWISSDVDLGPRSSSSSS